MEILLILGIASAAAYWLGKRPATTHPAGSPPPSSSPPAPTPRPAPAPPPRPAPPGLYPPATPGTLGLSVQVKGGDTDCWIDVYVGSGSRPARSIGPQRDASAVLAFGPGTWVTFRARVAGALPVSFSSFDHWEGPGVSSRQNPLALEVLHSGFISAHFAFLGVVA